MGHRKNNTRMLDGTCVANRTLNGDGNINARNLEAVLGIDHRLGINGARDWQVRDLVLHSVGEGTGLHRAADFLAKVRVLAEDRDSIERDGKGELSSGDGLSEGARNGNLEVASRLDVVGGDGVLEVLQESVRSGADRDGGNSGAGESGSDEERKDDSLHS